ncbi:MAG: nodulation protein NfeD [Deltaproteobacteria bacterium]|nr:nodulation protein NfeD [Deltaproteobacteria bacterium]
MQKFLLVLALLAQIITDRLLSEPAYPYVGVINIKAPIFMGTGMFIERVISQSKNAKAFLVYLDTPGGDLYSTQKIIQAFLNSSVPVIAYVHPSGATAASAGMFLLISAHIASMAPGTSAGAATPVASTGQELPKDLRNKAVQMTSTIARALGEERNRNVEWVKKAVEESIAATAQEALDNKVIDLIAQNENELFEKIIGKEIKVNGRLVKLEDLRNFPRIELEPSTKENILEIVSNPLVAGVIGAVGALGIILELYNPGTIIPGALGIVCLIISMVLLRTVTITVGAGLLILAGLGMVLIDLFLGSIVLMVIGAISAVAGLYFYFDPTYEPIELTIQLASAGPLLGSILLILGIVIVGALRAFRIHTPTGSEALIGVVGLALGDFKTEGNVFLNGTIWKAKNVSSKPISKNQEVKVVKVEGLTLFVEPI